MQQAASGFAGYAIVIATDPWTATTFAMNDHPASPGLSNSHQFRKVSPRVADIRKAGASVLS
jgi:hypothetical protein